MGRRVNNNKVVFRNRRDGHHTKTMYQFRRDREGLRERTAVILYLLGYPQTEAYRIAFNYSGKPSSLASTACRFFNYGPTLDCAQAYVEYFGEYGIPINKKDGII